jgi:hypothetical protein
LNELITADDPLMNSASMACLYSEFPTSWFGGSTHERFCVISSRMVGEKSKGGYSSNAQNFYVQDVVAGVADKAPYHFPEMPRGGSGFLSQVDDFPEQLDLVHRSLAEGKTFTEMELSKRKSTGRFRQTFDSIHELYGACFKLVHPHRA